MATELTRDEVVKLANLARINLDDHEIDSYLKDLNEIIGYVKQLADVDIAGLEPTNQVTGLKNVWREDQTIDYGYDPKDLLKNVPETQADYLKVKRVIE